MCFLLPYLTSPHHPSPFPLVYTLSILHSAACLSRASPRRNQKEGDGGIKGSVCSDCVPRRNGILHKVCCNGLVARLGGRRNVLTGVSEVLFNPLVRWNSLGLDWAEPPTTTSPNPLTPNDPPPPPPLHFLDVGSGRVCLIWGRFDLRRSLGG